MKGKLLSHVRLLATPWTAAFQAPPSMGFSREEYWSGLPFPSPGDLPDPEIEPTPPALAGGFFTTEPSGKSFNTYFIVNAMIIFKCTEIALKNNTIH